MPPCRYSEQLLGLVRLMLDPDPDTRPRARVIRDELRAMGPMGAGGGGSGGVGAVGGAGGGSLHARGVSVGGSSLAPALGLPPLSSNGGRASPIAGGHVLAHVGKGLTGLSGISETETGPKAGPRGEKKGALRENIHSGMLKMMGGDFNLKKRWVMRATSREPGPPKAKHVRNLVLDSWETGEREFL